MNNKVPRTTSREFLAAVLLSMTALAVAGLAHADLDTSNRTFIPLYPQSQITPTAVGVGSEWAAMGRGEPLQQVSLNSAVLIANPIVITGPWNGAAYQDVGIDGPSLGSNVVEEFGAAISIQGDRIAIGSPEERTYGSFCSTGCQCCFVYNVLQSAGGKVRLYLYDGLQFQPERTITFGGISDRFGQALALESANLLVGSPGAVPGGAHLFAPDTGTLITSFASPDVTGSDLYGSVLALDDDLAIVAAPGTDTVYIYRDDGTGSWAAAGTLTSPGVGSEFGAAVAADGDRIVVGAPGVDKAYIFEDAGTSSWPVSAELAGIAGSDFGRAVAIAGTAVFVGAPDVPSVPLQVGAVSRFDYAGNSTWALTEQIESSVPVDGDQFGTALSASASMLSVLAPGRHGQYVFTSPDNIYDPDGDGVSLLNDNCFSVANPDQLDNDNDAMGDACDDDDDNDGLSDADEALAGSNPLIPDTDGDGLLDGDDPYPTLTDGDGDGINDAIDNCATTPNDQADLDEDGMGDACDTDIDGDGSSNDAETIAGTDPYDNDSDDDGHADGTDDYPLDFKDGWAEGYRFQFNAPNLAVGSNAVLAYGTQEVRSYVETLSGWEEAPAPSLTVPATGTLRFAEMKGNRAAIYVQDTNTNNTTGVLYVFEWSEVSGWNLLDSIVTETLVRKLAFDGNVIAATVEYVNPTDDLWIYELDGTDLERVAVRTVLPTSVLAVNDGAVVVTNVTTSSMQIFEGINNYAGETVTAPIPAVGGILLTAGPGRFLVGNFTKRYWLEKDGIWALTENGIPPLYSDIGDLGLVGIREDVFGNHDIIAVRLIDGVSIGVLQNRNDNADFESNDVVVARSGDGWVDIFVLENVVAPPGC